MIDINSTSCRICLEEGAIYPIFESNDEFDACYTKLAACIQQKLEDIEGYPRNICIKCKNACDSITHFIAKFEKTHKILIENIVQIKTEHPIEFDPDDNHLDDQGLPDFTYDSEISDNNIVPKLGHKNPTELLESLSHLTIKRIKVEPNSDNIETDDNENDNTVKRKKGRPKRGENKKVAKKPVGKTKPTAAKAVVKNTARKAVMSATVKECKTEKKKASRNVDSKETRVTETTKKSVLCDHCGATYSAKYELQKHIYQKHTEKKHKCAQCPKVFGRKWDLINHKKRHDNFRPCVCDECGLRFYEKKMLNSHIRSVHEKIRVNKNQTFKCKFCERTFKAKRCALIHERSVHTGERPEVCQICGGSFYDVVYLREHMRIHTGHTPYKCPVCSRGYAQRGNMKSHMRNHKISELSPETKSKIKPGHFKFMRPKVYLDLLDEIKTEPDVDLTANENAPKLCDLCGITRKTADSLARHKIVAHQERKFKCTKCSNAYLVNRDLQRHVRHVHEKIRTAICDHCGKASFTKAQLRNHINTVHLNRKKKPLISKCRFCDKEFRYKKGAIIHERAVHTGERPAVCDVCGSSFYDESYLKEHMRLHTGDTPHKCPVCGRGYAQRGNMKSHMRNHKISELPADVLAKVKPSYYKFMRP